MKCYWGNRKDLIFVEINCISLKYVYMSGRSLCFQPESFERQNIGNLLGSFLAIHVVSTVVGYMGHLQVGVQ